MRIFALIFSFYILSLSVVPCCVFCGGDDGVGSAITAKDSKDRRGDEDGCKNCSPFTLCGHCVGFTVTARFAKVERVVFGHRVDWRETTPSYFFSYSASCWQPPRVG
ncbi:MAG TPA: DUF6660 family protein [Puia sp.]|jgi:hypothetical protein|nr:DUF6660 family protein [Puia sp.]